MLCTMDLRLERFLTRTISTCPAMPGPNGCCRLQMSFRSQSALRVAFCLLLSIRRVSLLHAYPLRRLNKHLTAHVLLQTLLACKPLQSPAKTHVPSLTCCRATAGRTTAVSLPDGLPYDIGRPRSLTHLWVNPQKTQASGTGASEQQAYRAFSEAWARMPVGVPLASGFHIHILPGTLTEAQGEPSSGGSVILRATAEFATTKLAR
jgi:hypothetical protein